MNDETLRERIARLTDAELWRLQEEWRQHLRRKYGVVPVPPGTVPPDELEREFTEWTRGYLLNLD